MLIGLFLIPTKNVNIRSTLFTFIVAQRVFFPLICEYYMCLQMMPFPVFTNFIIKIPNSAVKKCIFLELWYHLLIWYKILNVYYNVLSLLKDYGYCSQLEGKNSLNLIIHPIIAGGKNKVIPPVGVTVHLM